MDTINNFFDVSAALFFVFDYPVSFIELVGTGFGLVSVYFATKANVHTWTTGFVNILAFFVIYYQIRLYSDMFLQVFFFVTSVMGLKNWTVNKESETHREISYLSTKNRGLIALGLIVSTYLWGVVMSNIHLYLPSLFPEKAAFAYYDAFTTVLSIYATFLMIFKKVECWILWILVDIVCVGIYLQKGVLFISIEYGVFLIMAIFGFVNWYKTVKNEKRVSLG